MVDGRTTVLDHQTPYFCKMGTEKAIGLSRPGLGGFSSWWGHTWRHEIWIHPPMTLTFRLVPMFELPLTRGHALGNYEIKKPTTRTCVL